MERLSDFPRVTALTVCSSQNRLWSPAGARPVVSSLVRSAGPWVFDSFLPFFP